MRWSFELFPAALWDFQQCIHWFLYVCAVSNIQIECTLSVCASPLICTPLWPNPKQTGSNRERASHQCASCCCAAAQATVGLWSWNHDQSCAGCHRQFKPRGQELWFEYWSLDCSYFVTVIHNIPLDTKGFDTPQIL